MTACHIHIHCILQMEMILFFGFVVEQHRVSIIMSKIICISIVCWTLCSGIHHGNITAPHLLCFIRIFLWGMVDSPHKKPVMWKKVPYCDISSFFHLTTVLVNFMTLIKPCFSKLLIGYKKDCRKAPVPFEVMLKDILKLTRTKPQ